MATIEERTNSNGEKVFRIRVSCGYAPDGKQIVRSETWKPAANLSSREIKRALDRQVFQMEEKYAKTSATFRRIKFAELAEEWLESAALSQTLRISTLERMKGCRERTYAAIGNCYVDMLDFRTIQRFIFSLASEGVNKATGKGLSEKTQKHYLTFVSDVMKYAMLCGIIDRNPCQGVPVVKTDRKELKPYTIEEEIALMEKLESAPLRYRVYYLFLIYCGLRRSEALGLEWRDIDLTTGICSIVRTSQYRNKNTGTYTSEPKTKSSYRSLKLPEALLSELKLLKAERDINRVNCGDQWVETGRLFTQWNGKPMGVHTPYNWLRDFCKKENLPFKGIHAFRHAFATQAILNAKADVKTVSAILGHSQTSTTMDIYAHSFQEANAQALDDIAKLFKREPDDSSP